MTFLDLFRPRRRVPIAGTQPSQEREIQRHRGRGTAGMTPVQRAKDRPKPARSRTRGPVARKAAARTTRTRRRPAGAARVRTAATRRAPRSRRM